MTSAPQTVLITGATAGIGRHAALHLAQQGFRVFATGRTQAKLDAVAGELGGEHRLETLLLDVTDPESIAAARAEVDRRTGGAGIDVLINNAGYGHAAPMELVTDAEARAQFETNVFGLLAVTRAFLPAMRRRGSGRILNVSSVGGRLSFPLFGIYHATKYAVEGMSDSMRQELKPFGIDVVLIEPGPIRTNFADRSLGIANAYAGQGGDWEPIIARSEEIKRTTDRMSADPIVVTRAIERAITARSPRARYVAPFSSAVMLGAMNLLPTGVRDWMFRQSLGLTRRGLLAPTNA